LFDPINYSGLKSLLMLISY